ncbi:unnamed protein product [Meloidogyne enterolobii]|uniref:Uncharacterized protein n=1 Tax=Meloidogyne enterolobii TaxID=390850 RepID=A0ACB0XZA8_MELEN
MSTQLYILLLFLFLLFVAAFSLICLALLTPWTKRVKSYFYTKRYPFTLFGISKTPFVDVALNYSKQQNQNNPIYVLKLVKNIGKGGSVRAGVLCARGRFILFSDADGATKFSDFSKLEKEMFSLCNGENEEEKFNGESSIDWTHPALVVGSRAHLADEAIAKRSLLRTVLMLGFHAMVWVFTVRTVRDTQCGFKLFRFQ